MTRAELMARVSSAEITEWMAFSQIEPFGSDTQYIGPAITTAMLYNVNRGKGKAAKPADFMPTFERKAQGVSEMIQVAQIMTAAAGGTIGEEGE